MSWFSATFEGLTPLLIVWGYLLLDVLILSRNIQFWFGPLDLILKFNEDPLSGCWDIPLLTVGGRLPMDVVFNSKNFQFLFGQQSSSLKSEWDPIIGCSYISIVVFWDRLQLQLELFFIWVCVHLKPEAGPKLWQHFVGLG